MKIDSYLTQQKEYNFALNKAMENPNNIFYGISDGISTMLAAGLATDRGGNLLYICENPLKVKSAMEDLSFWLSDYTVLGFPSIDLVAFKVLAQSRETQWDRIETLKTLTFEKGPFAVVTTLPALKKTLVSPEIFKDSFKTIKVGEEYSIPDLILWLINQGYTRLERVEEKGEIALRGGILDIFPPTEENPVRIEFFDDEVDSIRYFDAQSQKSIEKTDSITISPGVEIIPNKKKKEEPCLLTDYFKGIYETVMIEPGRQKEADDSWLLEYTETCKALIEQKKLTRDEVKSYLGFEELVAKLGKKYGMDFFSLLPKRLGFMSRANTIGIDSRGISVFLKKPDLLITSINEWKRKNEAILISVANMDRAKRLQDFLNDFDVSSTIAKDKVDLIPNHVVIAISNLSTGFEIPNLRLVVVTEHELYNQGQKKITRKKFKDGKRKFYLDDLKPGDYVVHVNHGIGQFTGIENIKVAESQRDYLVINYSGSDRLFVPTDQAELLQKYSGSEGAHPRLSKLGGSEWKKAKAKAKTVIEGLADDLLTLYAAREALPGFAFDADGPWQKEFEDSFPYNETPDQLKAIAEVKMDMEKTRPMDRLLCGDVGYGKTEVAMRAAFKAVTSGKQVAVLVPTTVLAQQHFNTFRERFEPFGVNVSVLNRFKSKTEQNEIVKKIEMGKVDLVIGTHRLLSKDIKFKNLGLLVIDEEQRFGVIHKEKIKQLKETVDVLTLTATPIPRTLHMAMSGIRDLSVLETPPEERYPIQTFVVEQSRTVIREAIRREITRGGQVYYLHNRIEDIEKVKERLEELVPEATFAIGHARMAEGELERVMLDFMEGSIDVLICTTIIESGLDISNANTVIIDNADRLGLAQLYQIRGRVGRTNRLAYAYLTYTPDKSLTEDAEKRLEAIREFTELGAGYKIAMKDLEIRGAGNILGDEQHGQITAVGFDLYMRMLDEAVSKKKAALTGEKPPEGPSVLDDIINELEAIAIDLNIRAYIPREYMADDSAKIDFYQRINDAADLADIDEIFDELIDRFGDPPDVVENLLDVGKIKVLAKKARVASICEDKQYIKITMAKTHNLTAKELMVLPQEFKRRIFFNATDNLEIFLEPGNDRNNSALKLTERLLGRISQTLDN